MFLVPVFSVPRCVTAPRFSLFLSSLHADLRAGSCARRSDERFGLGHAYDWEPLPDGRHPFTVDDRSSIHFAGWGIAPGAIVDCEAEGMAAVSDIGLRANIKLAARHGRASRSGDIFVVYQLTTRLKYSGIEQLRAEVRHPPRGGAATADDGDGDGDAGDDANAGLPLSVKDTPVAAAAKMFKVLSELAEGNHLRMCHLRDAVRSSSQADNPSSLNLLLAKKAVANPAVKAALAGDRVHAVLTLQPSHPTYGKSTTKYRLAASPTWRGKCLASLPLNKPSKPGARSHEKFLELRSLLLARR